MALRVDYGGDYYSYENYYDNIHSGGRLETSNIEAGFIKLVSIMSSYRMLLFVVSFLYCSALFFLFKRYIPVKYWAFAFLVIFLSKSMLLGNMSGLRTSIAVSTFIYGFYFLEQGKKLPYIILMIGASFFHTSALFFLPAIFISPNKPSKTGILLLVSICFALAFISAFSPNVFYVFMNKVTDIPYFIKYEEYTEEEISSGLRGLSYLVIFFMLFLNIRILGQVTNPKESLLIKLSILYFILMLAPSAGLMSRLYFYLSVPFLAGGIYVINNTNNLMLRYAYMGSVLILAGLEFYVLYSSDRFSTFYLNYHSILFQ